MSFVVVEEFLPVPTQTALAPGLLVKEENKPTFGNFLVVERPAGGPVTPKSGFFLILSCKSWWLFWGSPDLACAGPQLGDFISWNHSHRIV